MNRSYNKKLTKKASKGNKTNNKNMWEHLNHYDNVCQTWLTYTDKEERTTMQKVTQHGTGHIVHL